VLQCVAVCCRVLQRVAVCCSVLQCIECDEMSATLQCIECNVLQCIECDEMSVGAVSLPLSLALSRACSL